MILSHIDVMDSSETSSEGSWAALRGSPIHIRDNVGITDVSLCLSQGVSRGELGLIAIVSKELGAILTASPKLDCKFLAAVILANADEQAVKMEVDGDGSDFRRAIESARSIVLAMKQGENWTDAVRASLASLPHDGRVGEPQSSCVAMGPS
jgi:hypothetical protein